MTKIHNRWTAALAAFLLAACLPVLAQVNPDDLLPIEEAFALQAEGGDGEVRLVFEIAEGYYMYRHAFEFEPLGEDVTLGEAVLPDGEKTVDEFFGETETYRDRIEIRIPVERVPDDGRVGLEVRSQGCADLGVCYPPERQRVEVEVSGANGGALPAGGQSPAGQEQSGGLAALLGNSDQALPAEEAFRFEAIAGGPGSILVRFTASPGYYLYRDQFGFTIADDEFDIARTELPPAEAQHDEYFGDTMVYFGEVEIDLALARPAGEGRDIELVADFQGCKDEGICYPPMTRAVDVSMPAAESAISVDADDDVQAAGSARPAAEQDRLAQALTGTPVLALLLFLVAGILLAFTPCVFPMVPILSGLIAGEGDRMTTMRAFRLSLVYVLAMALVYTAFGVVAGMFGQNLQALFQHPVVLSAFAALFVLLALAMFGFYDLQLPASWQTKLNEWSNRAEGGTLIGAALMGALSALIVGPCVAPALMGALVYIGQTGDAVLGGAALFAMAIGMGIPLVVWGTSAGRLLPRAGAWMNAVKAVFGVGLLALAIWMLDRIVPPAVTMLLWGALAVASGVYLGALTRLDADVSGWRKLWQALGVMLLVVGILQFVGAASGGYDWLRPLGHLGGSRTADTEQVRFREVDSLDQLTGAIETSQRPVMVDFYADWCVDCVRMERRTFTDPEVARRMNDMTLIKVDVTDYDDHHQEILSHYGLIGPPAYLFFDDGKELEQLRTFGFLNPQNFTALLDEIR